MFNQDRTALRQQYFTTWQKYHSKQLLNPLESQLIQVMLDHPEYHEYIEEADKYCDYSFEADDINPFLHMSMHLALRDQISADNPVGIQAIFERLLRRQGDALMVEHEMMRILTDHIWIMLKQQQAFNASEYLEQLNRL